MKLLLILVPFLFLTSCGNKELEELAAAEKTGLPKKIDDYLTLTSVKLNSDDNRLEYTFEVARMTAEQEAVMIEKGTQDFSINFFKGKKPGIMTVYENHFKIRVIFSKEGKKLKSFTLDKVKLM